MLCRRVATRGAPAQRRDAARGTRAARNAQRARDARATASTGTADCRGGAAPAASRVSDAERRPLAAHAHARASASAKRPAQLGGRCWPYRAIAGGAVPRDRRRREVPAGCRCRWRVGQPRRRAALGSAPRRVRAMMFCCVSGAIVLPTEEDNWDGGAVAALRGCQWRRPKRAGLRPGTPCYKSIGGCRHIFVAPGGVAACDCLRRPQAGGHAVAAAARNSGGSARRASRCQ